MILNGEKKDLENNCKLCGNKQFTKALELPMGCFSDGTLYNSVLIKNKCRNCGTISTKLNLSLKEFYKLNYSPSRNIDTVVVTEKQTCSRSEFVYLWIEDLIDLSRLDKLKSILEIGCGQGYLLNKFNIDKKFGVEPNTKACKVAENFLNVRNIGFDEISDDERYDCILSYCVIEHVENPNDFLEKKYTILEDDGIMIIALPIQDKFNYDLLFVDHIHHFQHKNFINLLSKNGFKVLNFELGRGSYSNIALYICNKVKKTAAVEFEYIENKNVKNIEIILENIENIISSYKDKMIYAFGYGEIAKTILPYTNLDDYILKYVDDYESNERVISSKESKLSFNKEDEIYLILLVNPMHMKKIKEIYKEFSNITFINIFDSIEMELV